jgi:outer membrane protein assembly factor BamB
MRRRLAIVAGAVLLLLLGLAGGYVLWIRHEGRNIRGSSTVEFVPTPPRTKPKPKPKPAKPAKPAKPGVVWPMYGFDPGRLRVAEGMALAPPFRKVWTFHARSLVEFPPAVAYGRLFFANNAGVLFAISAKTGKKAWSYRSGRCQAMSPAVEVGTVYATFLNRPPCNASGGDGELIALAAGTGKVRWRRAIGPSESSPLVEGGKVFVGDWNGRVACYEARTGKLVWSFQASGKVKGGLAFAGGRVYFGTYGSKVYALDAATGKLRWQASAQPRLGSLGTFYSTPAVAYDRVYIGSTDGKMYSFGATTGELRWSQSTGGYVYSSPAVWRLRVYAGSYSGSFYCFDAATGAIRWSFRANGAISGSPTIVAGRVYFSTLSGKTYGLDARTGRELWSYPDGKYSPVVTDPTHVFLVGYGRIYGLVERRR